MDALRCIDKCITVTPDEVNLAKLGQQVETLCIDLERTIDQVGGLVIKTVRHVEVGFRDRVTLIEVDGGLAAERVFERSEFAGISRSFQSGC